jgi:hypothetical protein
MYFMREILPVRAGQLNPVSRAREWKLAKGPVFVRGLTSRKLYSRSASCASGLVRDRKEVVFPHPPGLM